MLLPSPACPLVVISWNAENAERVKTSREAMNHVIVWVGSLLKGCWHNNGRRGTLPWPNCSCDNRTASPMKVRNSSKPKHSPYFWPLHFSLMENVYIVLPARVLFVEWQCFPAMFLSQLKDAVPNTKRLLDRLISLPHFELSQDTRFES